MPADTEELLAAVRDVGEQEIAPRAASVDADGAFPAEAIRELSNRGLGRMVPESAGGLAAPDATALAEVSRSSTRWPAWTSP